MLACTPSLLSFAVLTLDSGMQNQTMRLRKHKVLFVGYELMHECFYRE